MATRNRMRNPNRSYEDESAFSLEHCRQAAAETFEENPLAATLVMFGLGFGVGVLIGSMLSESDVFHRNRTAESLEQRILAALSDAVPEQIQRRVRS